MLPLALTSGHKVGLAVVAAVFIVFALGSALLIPRFRPRFPAGGLPAFIVLTVVLFFGMLTAVEVFGAEKKETKRSEHAAKTFTEAQQTTAGTATTNTTPTRATTRTASTTTPAATTTRTAAKKPQLVQVTEKEFTITLATNSLKAGPVTFDVRNTGKLPHDLAIVGGRKSPLIPPGSSAFLKTTLKAGALELYCSVPGHKQAGMDVKLRVS